MKLTSAEYDALFPSSEKDDLLEDQELYQRLVGRLLYLTMICPDISFAVQHFSQFMHCPKKSHYAAALRVVRYVKNKPGQGILLPSRNELKVSVYYDYDWASYLMIHKSISGFCVRISDALVSWKVKRANTVSRSSAEAEYGAIGTAVAETIWI